jgi:hypothetical protein
MTDPHVPAEAQGGGEAGSEGEAAQASPEDVASDPSRDRLTRTLVTLAKVLGVVVTFVTLIGGVVTVLFRVDPTLEPCIGSSGATFTAVQVFTAYPYTQYAADLRLNPNDYAPTPGVEVRYNYQLNNLSGAKPVLRGTLQQVASDGRITVPQLNGLLARVYLQQTNQSAGQALHKFVTPNRCSQGGSGIFWMPVTSVVPAHHHYRVVLELFDGPTLADRVGVGVTPIFDH